MSYKKLSEILTLLLFFIVSTISTINADEKKKSVSHLTYGGINLSMSVSEILSEYPNSSSNPLNESSLIIGVSQEDMHGHFKTIDLGTKAETVKSIRFDLETSEDDLSCSEVQAALDKEFGKPSQSKKLGFQDNGPAGSYVLFEHEWKKGEEFLTLECHLNEGVNSAISITLTKSSGITDQ